MGERFREEAAGAAGGVEDYFAKPRVGHGDHELNDGPGRVEFARVAGGVAHFAEHRLVEAGQRWISSDESKWIPSTRLMTSRIR
jgi:hypothetical protein